MSARFLAVIGTRPEAVKMAPLVRALSAWPGVDLCVLATGQHPHLLHDAWSAFGLRIDIELPAVPASQSLSQTTAQLLAALDRVIDDQAPDLVIAQGDTTSCLAAAMAAFYRQVPFAHLEAGLRSGTLAAPFPEEAQRQLIDRLSTLHFAPTEAAAQALRHELPDARQVHAVGNTVIDALLWMAAQPLPSPWPWPITAPHRLLVTAHRRENFGAPLASICQALCQLSQRPDVQILMPAHPNPAVHGAVYAALSGQPRVQLVAPLAYPAMVAAMRGATLLLTDSGGLQEEAPALGLPVLVLREQTERPEGVVAGTAQLVGSDSTRIVQAANQLLDDPAALLAMQRVHFPYGEGRSAERITALLQAWFERSALLKPPAGA